MEDAASTSDVQSSPDNAGPGSRYASTPTARTRPRDEVLDEHISSIRSSPVQEKTIGKEQRPCQRWEWDCVNCGQRNHNKTWTCRRCSNRRSLTIRYHKVADNPNFVPSAKLDTPTAFDDDPTQDWKHLRKRQSSDKQDSENGEPVPKGHGAHLKTEDPRLEEIDNQRSERLRATSEGKFVGLSGTSEILIKKAWEEVNIPEMTGTNNNSRIYHKVEGSKDSKAYNSMEIPVSAVAQESRQVMFAPFKEIVQPAPSPTAWTRWKPPMEEAHSPSKGTFTAQIESSTIRGGAVKMNNLALDKETNHSESIAETESSKAADTRGLSGAWAVWSPPVAEIEESTSSRLETPSLGPMIKEDQPIEGQNYLESPKKVSTPEQPASPLLILWKPPISEFQVTHPSEAEKGASPLAIRDTSSQSKIVEDMMSIPSSERRRPVRGETTGSFTSMRKSVAQTQGIQDEKSNDQDLTRDSTSYVRWRPSVSEPESVAGTQGSLIEDDQIIEAKDQMVDVKAARRAAKFLDEFESEGSKSEGKSAGNFRNGERRRSRRDQQYTDEYEDEEDMAIARAERKKQRKRDRAAQKAAAPSTPIILPEFISIGNLASALRVRIEEFVERMESLGFEDTSSDYVLDAETAGLIATEFNYDPIIDRGEAEDLVARPPAEDKSLLPPRPPVVTIMGHVDHGKTTLLDWLRKSSVAASEHGGITQHIGAFTVPMPSGKIITFLDTPGHAAFLSMRQRGANVTDIVILVVAADDSVKPQTVEAIKHAQTAKVPMIVAINKIDKEGSNVERVKQDLARHGVDVEDFGGDTQVVCVSGKTGQGMDELEDAAVALADIIDMRAETDGQAEGWVLEATTKKAGRVATVLVRRGTIYPGSVIVAGSTWAKIRTLKNEAGVQIDSAGPGTPVEVDGWREQPEAGDEVLEAPDEQKAKDVVDIRLERAETTQMAADMVAVNETRRMDQEKRERRESVTDSEDVENVDPSTGIKEVFFIIKGDVSGSVEAVLNSVSALGNEEVRPHILRFGVGPVSEFDVEHAAVAKGHLISFNTPVDPNISRMAEAAGVSILDQNIIYRLVDDVKAKLSEQLAPLITSRVLGEAEIAQVFDINTKGRVTVSIAGCKVRNGVVTKNGKIRVLRDRTVIYDGLSLQFSTHVNVLKLEC